MGEPVADAPTPVSCTALSVALSSLGAMYFLQRSLIATVRKTATHFNDAATATARPLPPPPARPPARRPPVPLYTLQGFDGTSIHCWSGPRCVSTSLMYAFAQRSDTRVLDEPLYAHWLRLTGSPRPYLDLVRA